MGGRWLTAAEYKAAPTAVDVGTLTYGGNSAAQDAQLVATIHRASGICDNIINGGSMVASARTWLSRVRMSNVGDFMFHPGDSPLVSVNSVSLGYDYASLQPVPASTLAAGWIDSAQKSFILPGSAAFFTSATPIQIGGYRPSSRVLAQVGYVAGYPSTYLTQTAAAGTFHIDVATTAGMYVGQTLTIVDGASNEQVVVTDLPTSTRASIATGLSFTHTFVSGDANQIAVHGFPEELRMAAILMTSALIKTKGNDALVMGQLMTPAPQVGMDAVASANIRLARDLLSPYKRTR